MRGCECDLECEVLGLKTGERGTATANDVIQLGVGIL